MKRIFIVIPIGILRRECARAQRCAEAIVVALVHHNNSVKGSSDFHFSRFAIATLSLAYGPDQSNGICLAELRPQANLKPNASTSQTVDLPQVTN